MGIIDDVEVGLPSDIVSIVFADFGNAGALISHLRNEEPRTANQPSITTTVGA